MLCMCARVYPSSVLAPACCPSHLPSPLANPLCPQLACCHRVSTRDLGPKPPDLSTHQVHLSQGRTPSSRPHPSPPLPVPGLSSCQHLPPPPRPAAFCSQPPKMAPTMTFPTCQQPRGLSLQTQGLCVSGLSPHLPNGSFSVSCPLLPSHRSLVTSLILGLTSPFAGTTPRGQISLYICLPDSPSAPLPTEHPSHPWACPRSPFSSLPTSCSHGPPNRPCPIPSSPFQHLAFTWALSPLLGYAPVSSLASLSPATCGSALACTWPPRVTFRHQAIQSCVQSTNSE